MGHMDHPSFSITNVQFVLMLVRLIFKQFEQERYGSRKSWIHDMLRELTNPDSHIQPNPTCSVVLNIRTNNYGKGCGSDCASNRAAPDASNELKEGEICAHFKTL